MLSILFRERGSSLGRTLTPPAGQLRVERFSRMAEGGPEAATLKARGPVRDLLEWLSWLAIKVEIWDALGQAQWWGLISRVEVEHGRVKISADIGPMANKVAVAFSLTSAGQAGVGERGTTAWASNADSVALFGIKELLLSLSDTSAAGAAAARDLALEERSRAQAGYEIRTDGREGGEDDDAYATIYCNGWWWTLAWQYAAVDTQLAAHYPAVGSLEQPFGNADITEIAQAIDFGAAINVQQIAVYIRKVGAPSDNVKIGLYSNPDDLTPTDELAAGTVSGASLPAGFDGTWTRLTLSASFAAAAGTYFVKVSRTGSQDAANYYAAQLDAAQGYGAGPFVRKGAGWAAFDADMPFQIFDNLLIDTGQQIKSLTTAYGQFLRQVRLRAPSGVVSESYRDGDSTARYEIEKMLGLGTTNKRRLLARVNLDRSVDIYEQAARTDRPYLVDNLGRIYDPSGGRLRPEECPAGVWMRPKDLPIINADFLSGLQAFFVERCEYDAETDSVSWQPANLPDPWERGVSNG